jgi:hypothetical protein
MALSRDDLDMVTAMIAPVIAEQLKALRERIEHLQREIALLKSYERSRRHRELAHDEDD